jgi:hypothetical protein
VTEEDARVPQVAALLKQLWLGLAAYRLFPGSVDRPGFVAAVGRIDAAARTALATGPVDVEVRGDRILHEGVELPDDEHLQKLALACFERRVERLTVIGVPEVEDLNRLYAVLSRGVDDLDEQGGAGEALRSSGVDAIELSRVGPAPVEGADHTPEGMEPEPGTARGPIADVLASELMVEDLHGSPDDQAETLISRLSALFSEPPPEASSPIDLDSAVHDAVTELPPELRRSVVDRLVERVRSDPVAERLIGTMSNAELTRALIDLGREGKRDPVQLAKELAQAGVRQLDIVDLTAALAAGREDAGTIVTGLEQLGIQLDETGTGAPSGSVMQVLADYLSATENDDVRAMREIIAAGEEELRSHAILALGDYLVAETDLERTEEVLDLWAIEIRGALLERDVAQVHALLEPVREAFLGTADDRRSLFEAYVRRTLDRQLVSRLVEVDTSEGDSVVPDLLASFGAVGVDVLLDLLAEEEDRNRRAQFLGVLRRTVRENVDPVTDRLSDPRWYVVRNAVSLLGSVGGQPMLPRIEQAAEHESPAVRREVASALVAAGGPAAVPSLSRLAEVDDPEVRRRAVTALGALVGREAGEALAAVARTSHDRGLRIHALEELAARPDGPELLRELASSSSRPRLPWSLRRRARSLARHGGRMG